VIDCSSEACSVALFDDQHLLADSHEIMARGHAERLVGLIAGLPDRGRAEEILVSRGPGSFTGVRIGIAAARALGVAWKAPVRGFASLALVAAGARERGMREPCLVAMEGGHGEWLVQEFDAQALPLDQYRSLPPDAAVSASRTPLVVGTHARSFVERRGHGTAHEALPRASALSAMPQELLTEESSALYARAPDARRAQ
jgi:tRNA threonylcarbamoyl adenosine modification protein YeaZ